MAGVFVSYRRDDSQGFAGRLADDLDQRLGPDKVFRDIEIPLGSNFTRVLHNAIAASDVVLIIIGRHWAGQSVEGLQSRLFENSDWVRIEIEAALAQGKHVIPVLTGGAAMPSVGDLPVSIQQITKLQAAVLNDRYWSDGIDALVARLITLVPSLGNASLPGRYEDSPAAVLRDISDRLLNEVLSPRPTAMSSRPPPSFTQRLLMILWRSLRKFVVFALVLASIYVGIRLFGNELWLGHLDTLEERLLTGWGRLQLMLKSN